MTERERRMRMFCQSYDAMIRLYDAAGNVIETHEHAGDFKEWRTRYGVKQKAATR